MKLCKIAKYPKSFDHRNIKKRRITAEELSSLSPLNFCSSLKLDNTGFFITIKKNVFYLNYKRKKVNRSFISQSTSEQSKLFPLFFENYILSEDFYVYVNITEMPHESIQDATKKLYSALFLSHQNHYQSNLFKKSIKLPNKFLTKLTDYQQRAVKWLLNREQQPDKIQCNFFIHLISKYKKKIVYKHQLHMEFQLEEPNDINVPICPGGILADETGLGKTVEILALILLNERKDSLLEINEDDIPYKKPKIETNIICICGINTWNMYEELLQCSKCYIFQHKECMSKHDSNHSSEINEPYLCSECWKEYSEICLLKSKATLIITPLKMHRQWFNEIRQHIKENFSFHVYVGNSKQEYISPRQLADCDIVITNYNVVEKEVRFGNTSKIESENAPLAPLIMIEWWRVVLDETPQKATMMRRIPAINRWAVSSTPIEQSVKELYGLMGFIGLEFLTSSEWSILVKHFMLTFNNDENLAENSPLIKILHHFMYCTEKIQIQNEFPTPAQTEILHRINFGPLERFSYTQQHSDCEFKFYNCWDDPSMNKVMLMESISNLRKCCSIPTADNSITSKSGVLKSTSRRIYLLSQTQKELRSHLEKIFFANINLGDIFLLANNFPNAVEKYEEVLQLADKYENVHKMKVKIFYRVHAIYNILQICERSNTLITAETEETYKTLLNKLEYNYIESSTINLCLIIRSFKDAMVTLKSILDNSKTGLLEILSNLLNTKEICVQTEMLNKINRAYQDYYSEKLENISKLQDLLPIIKFWFNEIRKEQIEIEKVFKELENFTSNIIEKKYVDRNILQNINSFVNDIIDCHHEELKVDTKELNIGEYENSQIETGSSLAILNELYKNWMEISKASVERIDYPPLCLLCKFLHHIKIYHNLISKELIQFDWNHLSSNDRFELILIRVIYGFFKPNQAIFIKEKEINLNDIKFFSLAAFKLHSEIDLFVKTYKTFNQSKMHMTLNADVWEHVTKECVLIDLYEHNKKILNYAQSKFDEKFARCRFLKQLATKTEDEPCPICLTKEELREACFSCGHKICWSCYLFQRKLADSMGNIVCSICRHVQSIEGFMIVILINQNSCYEEYQIKGDFPSKIAYVVELVLKLQTEHDEIPITSNSIDNYPLKILIFSHWLDVLLALADAMKQNSITYFVNTNECDVESFKNKKPHTTCLLMPLQNGFKGLNLIEATHVFLLEPILNANDELEAIESIQRFGQNSRPTTVHRFIVNETIEENFYNLILASKENSQNFNFENISEKSFYELFKLQHKRD